MTLTENLQTIFSAVPGDTDPSGLVRHYQDYLVKSLTVFIRKVSQSFQLNLDSILHLIANLDTSTRFSPGMYVYYDQLKEGYRQNNLHEIFDSLQGLKNLLSASPYVEALLCTSILTDEWERMCIPQMRSTRYDAHRSVQMLPLVHWERAYFPPHALDKALGWLQTLDAKMFREFEVYVANIKLYAGKLLESSTSARSFGALFLRIPYPQEDGSFFYFRNVVHELSHLHLYALAHEDPLVLNEEHELFSSPLRQDKRPMIGVYHAVFVLSRMVRMFRKYLEHLPDPNGTAKSMQHTQSDCFLKGFETIATHARLTKKGREILNTLEECAFE